MGAAAPQGYSGVVSSDGILYFGTTDGRIMAVDPSARYQEAVFPSSEKEWSFEITMPSKKGFSCGDSSVAAVIYGTPALAGGSVCVGIFNGKVFMLSPAARSHDRTFPQMRDGEWTYPRMDDDTIEPIVGSPVASGGTIYVCSSDARVYALDMTYGDEKWRSEPLGESFDKLWITPVVEDGKVYVSTFDGHLYTLAADDGSLLPWSFEADAGFVSSPVLYQDTILVGSIDRCLYAVKVGSDKPLWKFPGGNWFWASPVVADGVVYAACLDGKVYALDAGNGQELWNRPFDAGSPVVAPPVLAGDSLVVAAESGNIYVVDAKTGVGDTVRNPEDEKKTSIVATIWASFCVQDGVAYIRAQDDCLYAVNIARKVVETKFPLS